MRGRLRSRKLTAVGAALFVIVLTTPTVAAGDPTAPSVPPSASHGASGAPRPGDRSAPGVPLSARAAQPGLHVTFYWGLLRPEGAAEAALAAVSTPGSPGYRHFIAPRAVARRFGASANTIRRVTRFVHRRGLEARVDKSRLFLRVSGSVAEFRRAFRVGFQAHRDEGFLIVEPNREPALPGRIGRLVTDPVRTAQIQLVTPSAARARRGRGGPVLQSRSARSTPQPTNTGTITGYCPRAQSAIPSGEVMTSDQERSAYGLSGIGTQVPRGRRVPDLGLIEAGSGFSTGLLRTAARCFGGTGDASRIETDGMRTAERNDPTGEAPLDVQSATEILRAGGKIAVFEASGDWLFYFLPAASALNRARPPRVLSTSNGQCEAEMRPSVMSLGDAVNKRLGLIGTSVIAAAGDYGSSDCWYPGGVQTKAAQVDYPGSSPWVTAVGGSRLTLTPGNGRQDEVVWNDTPWSGGPVAGGGGASQFYGRPAWQAGTATGSTVSRTVPDLSVHASAYPGFPQVSAPRGSGFLTMSSGTSWAAPVTAAAIALINRDLARANQPPLGFLNPWLYELPPGSFFDITSGTNDLFGIGCCDAAVGYDQASGLGAPNFNVFAANVPPPG